MPQLPVVGCTRRRARTHSRHDHISAPGRNMTHTATSPAPPHIPADMLHTFATSTLDEYETIAATHPNTAPNTLHYLANTSESGILNRLATRPDVTGELMHVIITNMQDRHPRYFWSGHSWVTSAITHPVTLPTTLAALVAHPDEGIALAALSNPNTPPDAIHAASKDRRTAIRVAAAHHRHIPRTDLYRLGTSRNTHVRNAVDTLRRRELDAYTKNLPEPDRAHAHLLIDNGFPGWPEQLATTISAHPQSERTRTVTIAAATPSHYASRNRR